MRKTTLLKVAAGLTGLGVFGLLFVRSAVNVGAEPYAIARTQLAGWTVAIDPDAGASGVLLALWPPKTFAPPLFQQIFTRAGVSLRGPNPVAMPLVLRSELDLASTGALAPEALVQLARENGLESIQPTPRCMAFRRVSQPGLTREVFFVRFELPPFEDFRRQLAGRQRVAGASAGGFEPDGLSPVIIIAASDGDFGSWLPLRRDVTDDCLAPIAVE